MSHSQNQVSTEVLTHKIYYNDPQTQQLKTHYCSADDYLTIRKAVNLKKTIDLGQGKTIVFSQFLGGDRMAPNESFNANSSTFLRQSVRKELRVNGEYEIITREWVDKKTQKVLNTESEEKLIHAYSKEDIARYKTMAEAIKERHKTGKTISDILKDSLNHR